MAKCQYLKLREGYDNGFTIEQVLQKIFDTIDVVYLINKSEGTYKTLKNNELFDSMFGDSGDYKEMMKIFVEDTADRRVAK